MNLLAVFENHILIPALTAWSLAQLIKLPLEFVRTRRWNWGIVFSTGGMPSSHSALVAGTSYAIGLYVGFDSPLFALSVAIAMVVIYDATGIRRQAGKHARIINAIVNDLASGHPLKEEQLREMLGHTPLQAAGGVLLGLLTCQIFWMFWK
jgi:acid phosphatase family membrane protein YuiD